MSKSVVVVNLADVEEEPALRGRVNTIRRNRFPLDSGLPGVNLEFGYTLIPDGYYTPRHRHNFEQIRYTLDGVFYTGHGDMPPGVAGYFPEGAYYGPQQQTGESRILILQFQGPTGDHFLSNEEANATVNKLKAQGGKFEEGVYTAFKPDGKRFNKDSYKAIWEELNGRKLVFPKPRYRTPVMMNVENFSWIPHRRRPGVEVKHLGTFSEYRSSVGFLRMESGSSFDAELHEDAEIRYLLEGSVHYGGRQWLTNTYFYIPPGARTEELKCQHDAVFFTIGLPMLVDLARQLEASPEATRARQASEEHAQAA
jgi:hypothetical protein